MTRPRRGDYRIFVGAFPSGELGRRIQVWRQRIDPPTARISTPHVTLAGIYWRSGPPTPENESDLIARLQVAQSTIAPFDLLLGGIRRFGNRVLYLGVKPTDGLLEARKALLRIVSRDKHRRFRPHLTLAMRLSAAEMDAVADELRQTPWEMERWSVPVETLHLMQRGPQDPAWRAIAELQLEGSAE